MAKEQGPNPWGEKYGRVDAASAERDLRDREPAVGPDYSEHTIPASEIKELIRRYPELSDSELNRLDVVKPGTQLLQGSVYLDLAALEKGPFKAIGGEVVQPGQRLIAKRWTDYDIWNRFAGQDDLPRLDRPAPDRR